MNNQRNDLSHRFLQQGKNRDEIEMVKKIGCGFSRSKGSVPMMQSKPTSITESWPG